MSENSKNSPGADLGHSRELLVLSEALAEPEPEDREGFLALTPAQRIEWLVTTLRLLEVQFGHLVKPRS